MRDLVNRLISRLGAHGGLVLAAVLVIVAGTWGFVALADEVIEGETHAFDEWAVKSMRTANPDPAARAPAEVPVGPRWLHEMGRDATGLGGILVLTLLTGAVAGYLLLIRKYHGMWLVLASTLGAFVISMTLKGAFDRPRPNVSQFSYVHTSSFPSGHSMLSAAVYLTLGAMLARFVKGTFVKFYFLLLAMLVTGLVGVSRVYMGVHYPTDVLAGWTAGLVWALICWVVARYLQIRGKVERDVEGEEGAAAQATHGSSADILPLPPGEGGRRPSCR